MKKTLIVALLLSFLTSGAFAQVTFSGSAYAGVRFESGGGDSTVTTDHRTEGSPQFDLEVTARRENYGARLDTTFQYDGDAGGSILLNGIYGWVDFPGLLGFWGQDDSLRLTVGEISSSPWVLNTWHHSHTEIEFGDVRGFRVEYTTPLPGLSAGIAFRADGRTLQRSSERMVFGATFAHSMFVTVISYDITANGQFLFGFNFFGHPNLSAGFQIRAERLASWDGDNGQNHGALRLRQMVGYRVMRGLNVSLVATQDISREPDSDVALEFIPGAEFRFLPNLLGSLSLILASPDHFSTTNLSINPMLEFMLRGPAIFYMEYELRLEDMDTAIHVFGFGVTISAF